MTLSLKHKGLVSTSLEGGWQKLRRLGRLAAPAVATQVLLPLTAVAVTFFAAQHGRKVVAAVAVASRLEALLLVGITALSVAVVPYVARSRGQQSRASVDGAIAFSGKASVYWGLAIFLITMVAGRHLNGLFSDDAALLDHAGKYFLWLAPVYAAHGLGMQAAAIFNGAFLPQLALRLLAKKTLLFTIPAVFVGSMVSPSGIFAGIAFGHLAGAAHAALLIRKHRAAIAGAADAQLV